MRRIVSVAAAAVFLTLAVIGSSAAALNPLQVAYNSKAAPYTFINDNDEPAGLFVDIMDWAAERMGYDAEYIPYDSMNNCYSALRNGEVDIVLGSLTNSSDTADLQYTSELTNTSLCIVAPNDMVLKLRDATNYTGYRAAYEYGTASTASLFSLNITLYVSCGSQKAALGTLMEGKADMAIMNYDCCRYLLEEYGIEDNYTIIRKHLGSISYAMLVRPDDAELYSNLDSAIIRAHTTGTYDDIQKKWLVSEGDGLDTAQLRRIWIGVIAVSLAAAIVVCAVSAMNKLLKVKVAEKTAELESANRELDEKMLQLQLDGRLRLNIIAHARNGMVAFDSDGRVTLMNKAALEISGMNDAAEAGLISDVPVFGGLVAKLDAGSGYAGMAQGTPKLIELESGSSVHKYRCILNREGLDGNTTLMTVEDVTREEREKQELFEQEKNNYLNRIVAGIAHEIKNPLMSIRTAATLMRDDADDPDVHKAIAQFLPDEVDRINQLVEGLIQYARPSRGLRIPMDISAIVKECGYLLNGAMRNGMIHYSIRLTDGLMVLVNHDRIKQSLINIIMNGIESMERRLKDMGAEARPLTISINTYAEGPYAVITIRDEGAGMSPDEAENCTKPFFTTKETGTGLGLALVSQYMTENEGQLLIGSIPNEYTLITLKFRRYEAGAK